jgi:hypothetical protein
MMTRSIASGLHALSAAYRGAVPSHLPRAKIVFDHFHVVKLYNDTLSQLLDPVLRIPIRKLAGRSGTGSH